MENDNIGWVVVDADGLILNKTFSIIGSTDSIQRLLQIYGDSLMGWYRTWMSNYVSKGYKVVRINLNAGIRIANNITKEVGWEEHNIVVKKAHEWEFQKKRKIIAQLSNEGVYNILNKDTVGILSFQDKCLSEYEETTLLFDNF